MRQSRGRLAVRGGQCPGLPLPDAVDGSNLRFVLRREWTRGGGARGLQAGCSLCRGRGYWVRLWGGWGRWRRARLPRRTAEATSRVVNRGSAGRIPGSSPTWKPRAFSTRPVPEGDSPATALSQRVGVPWREPRQGRFCATLPYSPAVSQSSEFRGGDVRAGRARQGVLSLRTAMSRGWPGLNALVGARPLFPVH